MSTSFWGGYTQQYPVTTKSSISGGCCGRVIQVGGSNKIPNFMFISIFLMKKTFHFD
jgi:hypothetical protein